MDAFEKHLSEHKFQEPPTELREKCLAGLKADQACSNRIASQDSSGFWSTWLWPHPKVWGGIAAVWFLCFGLNQWTLSLPNYHRSSEASNSMDPDIQKITVLHYSLALTADNIEEVFEPQTPPEDTTEEGIRPKAFLNRFRVLEYACSGTALDTFRQRFDAQLPRAIHYFNKTHVGTLG